MERRALYNEIPTLMLVEIDGRPMVDTTEFLESISSKLMYTDYIEQRRPIISAYKKMINDDRGLSFIGEDLHTYLDANLALDFACWAVPNIMLYALEKVHDVFINGFAVSDTYITSAYDKIPKKTN